MEEFRGAEKEVLSFWDSNRINEKVRERNRGKKKFYFLDGPPYVTGDLGSHHIWVETTKDIVLRYKRYRGLDVHDRAGFDVHGLPIENKVEKMLGTASKADIEERVGIDKFVMACKEYAKEQATSAMRTYMRFGSSLDFKSVYMPYESDYISKGWQIFRGMYEKGLLYRELQPLAYCPRCETVLSAQGPEIEYEDETDPSVFVRFKIDQKRSRRSKLMLKPDTYLVIWTTTPWTLPANIAIAANPKEAYVTIGSEGAKYIVAKGRLDEFVGATGISSVVLSEFYGSELDGVYYSSPLEGSIPMQAEFAKYHRVILDEGFVSVSEGTGLLHVATGHGLEDYRLGKRNRLPVFSPVDQHSRFTKEAGSFEGKKVPEEANDAVLAELKANGSLLFKGSVRHSYPHCWRCNTKLITRSTEQWFINVERIKRRMLGENKKIKWHPEEASEWFADAVQSSPDWCISRQRYWGAPIPIWICGACAGMEVIGSLKELVERADLKEVPSDLHRPYVDRITFGCNSCKGAMKRVPDVFDVWYDSGISHTASLKDGEFERLFPADWITESRDQIRGWFTMLLRTSVAVYGKRSFNSVNIGGMIKDEIGNEMHRHLGNAVNANDLLEIASADGFRLWCASHPRWLELKLKKDELVEADSNIMTLYNIAQLVKEFSLLAELDTRAAARPPGAAKLEKEERWILSRLNTLIGSVTDELENYYVDQAVNEIKAFILEDLSRFYLKLAKQRAEGASKSSLKRIARLSAYLLRETVILSSIIIPFSCERIYQQLFSQSGGSIFMESWPKAKRRLISEETEKDFALLKGVSKSILYLRESRNVKLRRPLRSATVETADAAVISSVGRIAPLIEMYTNSMAVKVVERNRVSREIKPVFGKLGPAFKNQAQLIAQELSKADAEKVDKEIAETGRYRLHTDGGTVDILPEHFSTVEKAAADSGVTFRHSGSEIYVSMDETQTDEMKEGMMAREIIRRIQMMRKEAGLTRIDKISVSIAAAPVIVDLVKRNLKEIKQAVKAKRISFGGGERGVAMKEWDLEGAKVGIGVRKE